MAALSSLTCGFQGCSNIHLNSPWEGEREAEGEGSCDRFYTLGWKTHITFPTFCWKMPTVRPHPATKEGGKFNVAGQLYAWLQFWYWGRRREWNLVGSKPSLLPPPFVLLLLFNGTILSITLKVIPHFSIFHQPSYLFWLPKQTHIHSLFSIPSSAPQLKALVSLA